MTRLGEALELYLECQLIHDPAERERRIRARPELEELVLAMLGASPRRRPRRGSGLGRGGVSADDPPPA
jgi:hypothetical protein